MDDLESIVRENLEELNGLVFNTSKAYSKDSKAFFLERYTKILNLLPLFKKDSVGLEIGLAGGVLAFSIEQAFKLDSLYALEHPEVCKQYKKSFLDRLKKKKIYLKPVDLREGRMPWQDNFFDFVILSEVIEHLVPADIPPMMMSLNKVIKKKGFLIITTPNIASLLKRINLARGKNPIEFDLSLHEGATYGHMREYTMEELISFSKASGFKIAEKKYFMIDSNRSMFTKIEEISSKIYPPFANNLFLTLHK